jgi:hypothetical protein
MQDVLVAHTDALGIVVYSHQCPRQVKCKYTAAIVHNRRVLIVLVAHVDALAKCSKACDKLNASAAAQARDEMCL